MHEVLLGMAARGHEVRVFTNKVTATSFDGVMIEPINVSTLPTIHSWADIVFTQTSTAHNVGIHFAKKKPIVYFNHDPKMVRSEMPRNAEALLFVWNSHFAAASNALNCRSMVIPPPVHPERYETTRGDRITIINMNRNKGGDIFWQIVAKLPDHLFLGVEGAYGHQIKSQRTPTNAKVMTHTANIREVYAQTRLLLMPSIIETYGRVAIEAAASGIPTICTPTDGLVEALGDAGTYVASRNVDAWVKAIIELDNKENYLSASSRALTRSQQLNPNNALDELDATIRELNETFLTNK
jgi:glycosyltransferase involved in cell wall biosynthesis